ncbi:hypothetical protein [Paenibacillus sp. 2TAB19]|uniref:hypothetical protein n=1 Tax=Paenibacillus sp. 2TAB19 TaxID=3233003 RepID=UPI003F98D3E6
MKAVEKRMGLPAIIAAIVERQGEIDVTCYGDAMFPLLREGNISTFSRVNEKELRPGDVCLYASVDGELLIERIVNVEKAVNATRYTFRGDASKLRRAPIDFTSIIGRLKAIHRDGRIVYVYGWQARLLEAAALQLPLWPNLARFAAKRRYRRREVI